MPLDPSSIYSGLVERGFAPHQAAALAGNIQQESNFNPAALNQGEGANGLLQWRLDRWKGLQDFAAARGTSPTDVNTQLDYIGHEMRGAEAKNAAPFLSAPDLPSANAALRKYIRYGDNSEGARLGYASKFAGGATPTLGQAPQMAAESPSAAPMPAYGWSPNNAPATTAASPQTQFEAPPPPQLQEMPLLGAPRRPPDLTQLRAMLSRSPAQSAGFRFSRT